MWLASLRRLVLGNSRSPKVKQVRSQRRRIIPRLDYLEDRIVPSTITLPTVVASDVPTLVSDITTAASDLNNSYVVNLTKSTYNTGVNNTTAIGKNGLPVITSGANITINGNGATINGKFLARLFDVSSGATLKLQNLTLTGGSVSGSTAKGGAVYNSGNLTMTSVVVGGNSAKASSGLNGEGGGIYSNGGTLTLKNDVIGRKVHSTSKFNFIASTGSSPPPTTVGAANTAAGGSGGSGQGGGLYVAGGTVNISNCFIGGNIAFGGANGNGQGGGIFATFASGGSLTLAHDVVGNKVVSHADSIAQALAAASSSAVGAINAATAGRGGNGQGAGLYVNVGGGTVKISSATFAGNHASGGINGSAQGGGIYANGGSVTLVNDLIGSKVSRTIGHNVSNSQTTKQTATGSPNNAVGAVGGNGQGGGIYANSTTLSLTNIVVDINAATGGSGAAGSVAHFAGGAGGNAQGGGIYANAATVTLSGGSVDNNSANPGYGGNGAAGTAAHVTGGAGGTSGTGRGGGVYVQGGSLAINGASVSLNTVGTNQRGGNGGAGYSNATTSTYGAGGAGGAGGAFEGGNVFASNATSVTVQGNAQIYDATINGAYGGTGGAGAKSKAGGQGANAGFVAGGGMYVANGSVTLGSGVAVNDNSVLPGNGGNGGNGGIGSAGGNGGTAEGGGLYAKNSFVTVTGGTGVLTATPTTPGINLNSANGVNSEGKGGNGGTGTAGAGGNGGAGGLSQGGGVFASGSSTLSVTLGNASQGANIVHNTVAGGNGGSGGLGHGGTNGVGGAGGMGTGGGLTVVGDNLTLTNATVATNAVLGGGGGNGAATVNGVISNYGNGGNVQGGGLFVSNSTGVTVLNSTITMNSAQGGPGSGSIPPAAAGNAKYGIVGSALGGAMYADVSTVNVLNSTLVDNDLEVGANSNASKTTAHQNTGGTAQGGGLYAANGTLSLTNDTIAWDYLVTYTNLHVLLGAGAGLYNGPSNTLNLENTILALNPIFSISQDSLTLADATYSDLASDSTATAGTNDDNLIGGVNSVLDANLLPGAPEQVFAPAALSTRQFANELVGGQAPGNYGGLTLTLPLAWNTNPPPSPPPAVMGNPAIGNGDPTAAAAIATAEGFSSDSSATDQRGLMRDIDSTIDIGATETQVVLNGSPSVTSVAASDPITYTLTVTNNESTTVNVTLTDAVPAFTSYSAGNTSGTGWTSIVEPDATNLYTLTATATLSAGATATLTFTVTAASNVPGNTVIKDTASIAPTGNTAAGVRSVTMDSTVPGASYSNITNEVEVHNNAIHPDPHMGDDYYKQKLMVGNDSGTTLQGPIAIVLTNLTPGVTLANATGTVSSGPYAGDPYIDIVTSIESWLSGWRNFLVVMLEFYDASDPNAANSAITYTPVFVQGI